MTRTLVAGVGNIFLGDDAFGVEVARRLAGEALPEEVDVGDFGIAGLHLAFQLSDGYDSAVLIDAAPRGGRPGDLYVIDPVGAGDGGDGGDGADEEADPEVDAHGMAPDAVLRMVGVLGGGLDRVLVVGCEPGRVEEGMGLSPPVAASVERAVAVVKDLLAEWAGPEEE